MLYQIDASKCQKWGSKLAGLQKSYVFEDSTLNSNHSSIQASLEQLSTHLLQSASQAQSTESSLLSIVPSAASLLSSKNSTSSASGSVDTSGLAYLSSEKNRAQKAVITATGAVGYALNSAEVSTGSTKTGASADINVGDVQAKGTATAYLVDSSGNFDPGVYATGSASASLLAASAEAHYKNGLISASASASGQLGTVYATGEAYVGKNGVILDGSIGAAAIKGQSSCSLSLGTYQITLTGTASALSAELAFSGSISSDGISFGSCVGLGVGLGYNVKIEKNKEKIYSKSSEE